MLIYNQLDAVCLATADASRRIAELLEDPEWEKLTQAIANSQPPHIRKPALLSLRTGARQHLLHARTASDEFRLLADLYLQLTNQSMPQANTRAQVDQPIIPHADP